MNFTEAQIESLAPKPAAFKEGKKLAHPGTWKQYGRSDRALWGIIQGSGASPYYTGVDLNALAYKCTCPSRQFPCKHSLGLLLLFATNDNLPSVSADEPDWISEWVTKRVAKQISQEKEKTIDENETEDPDKERRLHDRIMLVDAGVKELVLWLRDLIRTGLLELPSKTSGSIDKVAARMIDCKAPGLAGWVKSLSKINYGTSGKWEDETLDIIGKLNLLIRSWNNISNLSEPWQQTIRNLVGWSQSTKELADDPNAFAVKDEWIVLGQETETNEDLVVQKTWFWGCEKNNAAMFLQFATKFTPLQSLIIPGSIIEAEIAYFPGVHKLRGIIRRQRGIISSWKHDPVRDPSLDITWSKHIANAAAFPWINDQPYLIDNVRLQNVHNKLHIVDINRKMLSVHPSFDVEKYMQWLMITGGARSPMAIVLKGKKALPLGLFLDQSYIIL